MKKLQLSLSDIDARLRDLDEERDALTALRRLYAPESEIAQAPPEKTLVIPSRRKTATPPLIVPTGATPAILKTVTEHPGIRLGDLIDAVLKTVPPTNQASPRKNIANIVAQQVKRGRIEKRVDGFYVKEGS